MQPRHTLKGIVLSDTAPREARTWLVDTFADAGDAEVPADIAAHAVILLSELVADAVDHGSDEATIRLSIDDDAVCIELFDAPRRSIVAITGREEACPPCVGRCSGSSPTVGRPTRSATATSRGARSNASRRAPVRSAQQRARQQVHPETG